MATIEQSNIGKWPISFEPEKTMLKNRWARQDLNLQPMHYECTALTD